MSRVTLQPMTQVQFSNFMEVMFAPYVAERAVADHVPNELTAQYARDQHAQLLPQGHLTPGHRFLNIVAASEDRPVGGVWLSVGVESKHAFLYNITVLPQYRRRGFASDTLTQIEEIACAAGCTTLGLNVFSSNAGAMALYRKNGFGAVSAYMNKVVLSAN